MVSRRNYFSICIMMLVLLFMFQFLQVFKESGNAYDINEHIEAQSLSGADRWKPQDKIEAGEQQNAVDQQSTGNQQAPGQETLKGRGYVLYIGAPRSVMGDVVQQWCLYTKRSMTVVEEFSKNLLNGEDLPELLLVDGAQISVTEHLDWLKEITSQGVPVIFCSLPDADVIEKQPELQELLGIKTVKAEQVEVEGVQMFSGFLLGGEMILKAKTEEEQKKQDLKLSMPWYVAGKGTKTYMVGMLDEKETKREEFPLIIWRHHYGNSMVFAINGDYMSSVAGLGILDAFLYELGEYAVYPITNAQNTVVTNFPSFAEENETELMRIYSRSQKAVQRDVMWPGLVAMSEKNKLKLTFCMAPQYDYKDDIEPDDGELTFYLRQMKEIGAEAGKTFTYRAGTATLAEKWKADTLFWEKTGNSYQFAAYFMNNEMRGEVDTLLEGMQDVRTIASLSESTSSYQPISYYSDAVTLQCVTANAEEYTYSKELERRGLQTALGYSNVLIPLEKAFWPEKKEDYWEIYFDEVASNMSTYWLPFSCFQATTLSESDKHIRSFLNLDYREQREGNVIRLQVTGAGGEAWFVLRLHGEQIAEIVGAEYQKIEENAYLLHVLEENVTVNLEPSAERQLLSLPVVK